MRRRISSKPMSSQPCFLLLLFLFLLLQDLCLVRASSKHSCNGSIAECGSEEEMLMESEISQRFLEQQRKYISIGALKKDHPACDGSGGGQPYTKSGSCAPPPTNPYNRGCSKIYRCRSDDWWFEQTIVCFVEFLLFFFPFSFLCSCWLMKGFNSELMKFVIGFFFFVISFLFLANKERWEMLDMFGWISCCPGCKVWKPTSYLILSFGLHRNLLCFIHFLMYFFIFKKK